MKAATQLIHATDRERRRQDLMWDLQPYRSMLHHVISMAPMTGFIMHENGRMEPMPLPTEWQQKIDKILAMEKEYIKDHYPEFYNEEQHNKD